ncbi:MAG: phospholipase D-like domain-containing protein [Anaerolineales bacterium]|jgi:phosphatidylserine/phosphatidylglycerophosphate/cardiolipin synthase-like enzyme
MIPLSKRLILLSFILLIFIIACEESAEVLTTSIAEGGEWYSLYFSDPTGPNADTQRNGPDSALAEAIDNARVSVDAAIYDLNLWSIRDALVDAHHRGVAVRVVVESDNRDRDEVQDLIEAGIEVLGDRREGLMHHKFVVIDEYEVWTGSMNFTLNGAYHNDNNLIRIRSASLAEDYVREFEEMFVLDLFGGNSIADTPNPLVNAGGTSIEVYFSPDDGTQERLVALIDGADSSVYMLAFSFTADPIADALWDAYQRGVDVVGVIETSQASGEGGDFFHLVDAGMMDLELDGNPKQMHHKVFIFDEEIVALGSYNFTRSAEERNDENTLIIYNTDIAALFLEEFYRIYEMRQ